MTDELRLFPRWTRRAGVVLVLVGLGCGYLYYFGGRPTVFDVPVFALASFYAEARFLVFARTNLLDELFAICCLSGLVLVASAKEKDEGPHLHLLRLRALMLAMRITWVTWVGVFLLIYGWPTLPLATTFFALFLVAYYASFRWLVRRSR